MILIEKRGSSSSPNQVLNGDTEDPFPEGKARAMATAWPTSKHGSISQYSMVKSEMSRVIDRDRWEMGQSDKVMRWAPLPTL